MKLNASAMMVAVAMMVGSFGAMGCQPSAQSSETVAPEESVQSAPVESETASKASTESDTNALRYGFSHYTGRSYYYAPHAPPAARYEVRGGAPSARHFWAPGYYRWNGRQHMWYGGRWEIRRNGYEYIGPRWIVVNGRHAYVPGHWARRYY